MIYQAQNLCVLQQGGASDMTSQAATPTTGKQALNFC